MDAQARLAELKDYADHPAFRWLGRLTLAILEELRLPHLQDLAENRKSTDGFMADVMDRWHEMRPRAEDDAEETYLQTNDAVFMDHVITLYADPFMQARMRSLFVEPADRIHVRRVGT